MRADRAKSMLKLDQLALLPLCLECNIYELGVHIFREHEDATDLLCVDQVLYRDVPGIGGTNGGDRV